MGILSGKVVIVTGGTRGIGYAMARCFTDEGADLAFIYRSSVEKAKSVEEELGAKGVKVKGYQSDVADFKFGITSYHASYFCY